MKISNVDSVNMKRNKSDINILVVEDDQQLRVLTAKLLRKCGFQILEAASGKAALEIFKNNRVDLILSDIRMPDGDGNYLLEEVRKINPDIPHLVFITGFGEERVRSCMERGAFRVLSKPCPRSVLLGVIDQALGLDNNDGGPPRLVTKSV